MLTYYLSHCCEDIRANDETLKPCDARLVVLPRTSAVKDNRVACPSCGRVYSLTGPSRQYERLDVVYRYSPERVQRLAVDTVRSRSEAL